jgi:hypothetical protein
MERRVLQPGAAQVRRSLLVGEGGGIFPGRLPFMDPVRCERLLRPSYSHQGEPRFPLGAKKFVKKRSGGFGSRTSSSLVDPFLEVDDLPDP